MAKKMYIGDSSDIARKISKAYVGDSNNIARKIIKGYVGDSNNIAREFFRYYTPLNYIESTGTQYIDTGIKINSNSKIITKLSGTIGGNIFAEGVSGSYTNSAIYVASATQFYNGRWRSGSTSNVTVSSSITGDLNTSHDFELSKDGFYIDNSLIGATSNYSFTASNNLYLFAMNNQGTATSFTTSARIYSFKIYDNGTLVIDFIPVLDENDVACLYDKISGQFFYNQGTGTFNYN